MVDVGGEESESTMRVTNLIAVSDKPSILALRSSLPVIG